MSFTQFELAVADLAERDGFTIEQACGGVNDRGADVIAVAPDGRTRVVIQCKHTRRGKSVGAPVLYALNGTARPVHGADVVVAITNGSFSEPAIDFADSQQIKLIGHYLLRQWATWGTPLAEVLCLENQPVPPVRPAREALNWSEIWSKLLSQQQQKAAAPV
ncbi:MULTISPECIES: restriction endonuclease [Streptacidiphilus]|uniref:Restriction endonuclease n=1 Tax=Streptacidiphilus cavernicola TaxID=3342716 RepID=A0ABV6UWE2_9ACTN|nr:restriction endonuclease [Streptacidiphilus jeojiense]